MISVYVEHRVGDIAVGYRYYPEINAYESVEQIADKQCVEYVNVDDVPEGVKKAVSILLTEGN